VYLSDVFDECKKSSATGWTVGIKLPNLKRENARFVFSVQPDDAKRPIQLLAHKPYEHNTWSHVTVSFNGTTLGLYINGAKITKSIDGDHSLFKDSYSKCVGLFIGGLPDENVYFRGKIDEIGLWSRVLEHSEIVEYMQKDASIFIDSDLVFADEFSSLGNWEILSDVIPRVLDSDIVLPYHTVRLEAPPCGKTVCDDPEVVFSYLNHTHLKDKKRVKYRVVNIMTTNGKRPMVDEKQVYEQHKTVSRIFEQYNIFMELSIENIRNSSLADKVIMFDCLPYKIGDGFCDQECAHSTTGNDAGDCDYVTSECSRDLLENGYCNQECNKAYHNYDNGDCCLNTKDSCIDPKHPGR